MWLACLLALASVAIWQAWSRGPRRALGAVVVLSLLLPTWLVWQVAGQPIHLRVVAGAVGLIAYCLHPKATFRLRLGIVDSCVIALLGLHVVSDWLNSGLDWVVPVRAYGEWAIPYLAGRLALQSIDDVRGLLPIVVAVAVFLAAIASIESVTRVNLEELTFGNRPVDRFSRDASRFGLKRSFGPTMHPIYFGALQVLLFPWTLYAAARTKRGEGIKWWRGAPYCAGMGVILSMSRAPQLALVVVLYVVAVLTQSRYRTWLIGLGAALFVGGVMAWQAVLYAVHLIGGELPNIEKHHPTIIVEDEKRPVSSALTRFYLFDVYGLAMRRAGWLGFGTERTSSFPPQVPVGPQHAKTLRQLFAIDNVYILLVLRFGYLGAACFALLGFTAIATFARLSVLPRAQGTLFFAGMAGGLSGTMLLLLTVWMPHDFGFWFLWSIGAAGGLGGESGSKRPE